MHQHLAGYIPYLNGSTWAISNGMASSPRHARTADHQSKTVRREFPFARLLSCGLCGCSIFAELKKRKYLYYHCTGVPRGRRLAGRRRERFGSTEAKARENAIKSRSADLQRLSHKLDTSYEDRLEGRITKAFYDEKAVALESQKAELTRKLNELQNAVPPSLTIAADIAPDQPSVQRISGAVVSRLNAVFH